MLNWQPRIRLVEEKKPKKPRILVTPAVFPGVEALFYVDCGYVVGEALSLEWSSFWNFLFRKSRRQNEVFVLDKTHYKICLYQ